MQYPTTPHARRIFPCTVIFLITVNFLSLETLSSLPLYGKCCFVYLPSRSSISLQSSNKIQSSRKIERELLVSLSLPSNEGRAYKNAFLYNFYHRPLFMLYFQSSYNDPRARVYMWLSSTILSSRNVENSTAILRQTCSKVAEICLLLKSCSKFLYYKSNRGIRTQSHFSATFPKGTLDSLVSGYLRQKYDLLSRTVEILKLPAFFWISFCKALLLSAGLEKSHEAHSNQSNAIIGLLHWATSKSYPNRHLSCLYTSFPILLLLRLKW